MKNEDLMATTKPEQTEQNSDETGDVKKRKSEIVRRIVEDWNNQPINVTPDWRRAIEAAKRINSEETLT